MKDTVQGISINDAVEELLKTDVFKNIIWRTNIAFAQKLAMWLVRYILVVSSMNESLGLELEEILVKLHGEKFRKILEITEKTFKLLLEA